VARDERGRIRPSHTLNPGGRPAGHTEIRALARSHSPAALKTLVCRRKGCKHRERCPDSKLRHCPTHGAKLWPRPEVRPIRFHDLRHTAATCCSNPRRASPPSSATCGTRIRASPWRCTDTSPTSSSAARWTGSGSESSRWPSHQQRTPTAGCERQRGTTCRHLVPNRAGGATGRWHPDFRSNCECVECARYRIRTCGLRLGRTSAEPSSRIQRLATRRKSHGYAR
jgi:hypothetical protein